MSAQSQNEKKNLHSLKIAHIKPVVEENYRTDRINNRSIKVLLDLSKLLKRHIYYK